MDRIVARKRPAQVISHEPIARPPAYPKIDTFQCGPYDKPRMVRDVHRLARRGEISSSYQVRQTYAGWEARVVVLRPPSRIPPWARKAFFAFAISLAVLALLALLLKLIVEALIAVVPMVVMGLVILAGVVVAIKILGALFGGGGTTITQTVKIK